MPEPITETYLARIQTDPNSGPAPVAVAYFGKRTTIDGQAFEAPWSQVSWPLHGTDKTTTINGVTLTDAEVSAFVVAIADREFAAAQA